MNCVTSTAVIVGLITTTAVVSGAVSSVATILNTGVNSVACPIILSIDGGSASTASYPAVNGLLNGGSS